MSLKEAIEIFFFNYSKSEILLIFPIFERFSYEQKN